MVLPLLENRYQIINSLGEGGFGKTFLAKDIQMPSQRKCVIKQLKVVNNNDKVYKFVQEKFAIEAQTLEILGNQTPQIPKLYAYFNCEDQFYLVQEWIEGDTLTEIITKHGKLNESQCIDILKKILPVLETIHQQNIIHRDLKPDNIIVRNIDKLPVLIDFGAVKEMMGTVFTSSGNMVSSIIIGTPGYMSPEQGIGKPIYSSDLYSLVLSIVYLLTQKHPQELPTDHNTGEVIWQQPELNLSEAFTQILNKALKYNPSDRYPTATEMLQALSFATSTSHTSTPIEATQATKIVLPSPTKITQNSLPPR